MRGIVSAAMRTLVALLALGALLQQPPRHAVVQDGDTHGDPPYLLEEGWEPLLNGTDLAGWKSCEAAAKNEWYTTRSVRYERYLGPTQLNGRAAPSGVILNGPTGRTANLCTERSFGDIDGPTRAHLSVPESPQNPLMIQGDHGPVAFRNIYVRPLRPLIVR